MKKADAINNGVLAAEASFYMDHLLQHTWDGKLAIRRALNALFDMTDESASDGGFEKELEQAKNARLASLEVSME